MKECISCCESWDRIIKDLCDKIDHGDYTKLTRDCLLIAFREKDKLGDTK